MPYSVTAALRRSKKRVRAVISTELPFLLAKEFAYDQENNPCATRTSADGFTNCATADMHRARWSRLFDQMEKALSEEEKHLVSIAETLRNYSIDNPVCLEGFLVRVLLLSFLLLLEIFCR